MCFCRFNNSSSPFVASPIGALFHNCINSRLGSCFDLSGGSSVVDVAAFPDEKGAPPVLAVGLRVNPGALVVWNIRKLQTLFSLPVPGSPSFTTLTTFLAPRTLSRAQQGGGDDNSGGGEEPLRAKLDDFHTPPLTQETSAWQSLCEGTVHGLRELGRIVLTDPIRPDKEAPLPAAEEPGDLPYSMTTTASSTFRVCLVGCSREQGQAHLIRDRDDKGVEGKQGDDDRSNIHTANSSRLCLGMEKSYLCLSPDGETLNIITESPSQATIHLSESALASSSPSTKAEALHMGCSLVIEARADMPLFARCMRGDGPLEVYAVE